MAAVKTMKAMKAMKAMKKMKTTKATNSGKRKHWAAADHAADNKAQWQWDPLGQQMQIRALLRIEWLLTAILEACKNKVLKPKAMKTAIKNVTKAKAATPAPAMKAMKK